MHRQILFSALLVITAGCASAEREAFDPGVDPRIGAEVRRACFSPVTGSSGGYREIGGWDAFVTGRFNERYLLVFSKGCGNLGPAGAFPVFRNHGDNCRRRGEGVQTAQSGIGVSGGCTIKHIYEWNPDAEEAADESGS